MDTVLNFFKDFFKIEAEARFTAQQENKFEESNAKAISLYSFCVPQLKNNLGVIIREYPKPKLPSFIPTPVAPTEQFNPRFIYKISKYSHSKYDEVYVTYCSHTQPSEDYHDISAIFIAIRNEQELKICRHYIYDGDQVEWHANEGIEDLNWDNLGKPTAIKRLLEPADSKRSMKLYTDNV